MKKLIGIGIIIVVSIVNLNCTSVNKHYDELIIGKWKADSLKNIFNGHESIIHISDNDNLYLGSINNPAFSVYTKFHEALFYKQNDSTTKLMSSYYLGNDSIITKSLSSAKILKLTDTNLILLQQFIESWGEGKINHSITTYYTKISNVEN